jgi:hypothetical protein
MRSDVHSVSMGILIPAVLVLVSPSDVTAVTSEDGAAHPNSVGSVAWRCGTMITAKLPCQWPRGGNQTAMTTCVRDKSCVERVVVHHGNTIHKTNTRQQVRHTLRSCAMTLKQVPCESHVGESMMQVHVH